MYRNSRGAYAIWRGSQLVYAGMSGKAWQPNKKNYSHLRQRLRDHANGTRADVFQSHVFERFVGRHLPDTAWALIESGQQHMNEYARDFIRGDLSFSFVVTANGEEAGSVEAELRRGVLGVKPLINPL